MTPFKPITPADKEIITSYILHNSFQNCDLSFANLCSWRFLYETEYALIDDFILFRFYAENHLAYMYPVGKGDIKIPLKAILDDAHALHRPFFIAGVCGYMHQAIEEAMPGMFVFADNRDYSDYI